METVAAIGPQQINHIGKTENGALLVTVTYPVGEDTVLSVQPNGDVQRRPKGTTGPFELAILRPDRLVYAPQGASGAAFILPFCDEIPNA